MIDYGEEGLVVCIFENHGFKAVERLPLAFLNSYLVHHVLVDESDLLIHFKQHLAHVVFWLDVDEGLLKLLFQVLSVVPFQFQDIHSNLAHGDSVELGTLRVYSFANKSIFISFVVLLVFNCRHFVVLVVVRVHVEEVYAVHIYVVDILLQGVA